jgi:hypothetical protein
MARPLQHQAPMNRGTHWGALLFTLAIAAAALPLLSVFLLAPLSVPASTASEAEVEEETAEPASLRTPLPEELHSQWSTQTVAPVIDVGETAVVTMQFRNVGHTPWIKNSPSEVRLGEVGSRALPPAMRLDWFSPDRPAAQTESIVHEFQLATFTFKVTGTAPGTYRLRVRPVVDGVKWLQDEGVYVDITVRD